MEIEPGTSNTPVPMCEPGHRGRCGIRRRVWSGVVLLVVAAIPVFLLADWVYRGWIVPPVDPYLIQPVTIRNAGDGAAGDPATDDPATDDAATDPADRMTGLLEGLSQEVIDAAPHPLDPVLDVARRASESIRRDIRDYRSVMINRVRLDDGRLRDEQYLFLKVRHEREEAGRKVPFAVYTRFLKPQSMAGQEAIWIEGQNDNKLVGHPAGLLNLTRLWLEPDGPIAMRGNRYPMWDLGVLKLLEKMIEKGERDRAHGPCRVRLDPRASINGQPCVMIEVCHPEKKEPFDFHLARIYIDVAAQLPVAYEGYLWPETPGGEPPLLESYIYQKIERNVGLTDEDFDPDNPDYSFPGGN